MTTTDRSEDQGAPVRDGSDGSGSASVKCSNCGATLPREKAGTGPRGEIMCCAGCLFNPLGCRCKYGELGVLETFVPPFDEDDDDNQNNEPW